MKNFFQKKIDGLNEELQNLYQEYTFHPGKILASDFLKSRKKIIDRRDFWEFLENNLLLKSKEFYVEDEDKEEFFNRTWGISAEVNTHKRAVELFELLPFSVRKEFQDITSMDRTEVEVVMENGEEILKCVKFRSSADKHGTGFCLELQPVLMKKFRFKNNKQE